MKQGLYVEFNLQEQPHQWWYWKDDIVVESGHVKKLSELSSALTKTTVTVILSGLHIQHYSITVPPGPLKKIIPTIPFLLEGQLLKPIESYTFTPLEHDNNQLSCYVTTKQILLDIECSFAQSTPPRYRVISDYLLLPYKESEWSFRLNNDLCSLRTGLYQGYTFSNKMSNKEPPICLQLIIDQAKKIDQLPDTVSVDAQNNDIDTVTKWLGVVTLTRTLNFI